MNIAISGYGRMGHIIEEILQSRGHKVIERVDVNNAELLGTMPKADVLMDFSHPTLTPSVAAYVMRTGTPLVCGTTGMHEEQLALLKEASANAPVLYSANYSLGIAVFKRILQQTAKTLLDAGFEAEITETHHDKKVDAPSGTAKLLYEAIDPKGEYTLVYGREGQCGARTDHEIGMHSLRGGTVAGEHTVDFFGNDELIEITHRATSRRIFAEGAVRAAEAIASKPAGFYTLEEVIF